MRSSMTPLRLSPIHSALQSLAGTWQEVNGMPTLMTVTPQRSDRPAIGIADVSCLTRFGVKGAAAADWLQAQGIADIPPSNAWRPLPGGGLVARLGLTEFLIEDSLQSQIAPQLFKACQSDTEPLPAKVYPVLRQDLAIVLCGELVPHLFLQTCNLNVRALNLSDRPIAIASMIGVAVTILPDQRNGLPFYRLWCDGTYGLYFWRTLLSIVQELGGDAIGIEQVLELN